ncbi:WYL domain-containing protein [Paenibacillus agricola]|uniref:WYL domain-containing protein n=1 Tax=Paenibacillus agricola TaxID=2716264 RepID=A0ABX0JFW0_9BACL|nr:WYL domain-containing protein [Paenibacillus agricola]NHN33583.1 WYL domain-containing protein [Paenibacillus agricola]
MEKTLCKYIGHIVEIIYQGPNGQLTQRRIEIRTIGGRTIKAYCMERKAPQVFRIDNVLAVHPLEQIRRTS